MHDGHDPTPPTVDEEDVAEGYFVDLNGQKNKLRWHAIVVRVRQLQGLFSCAM